MNRDDDVALEPASRGGEAAQKRLVPLGARIRHRLAELEGDRRDVDLIVMANEISFAHGTGILMSRVLEEVPSYVLLRAFDHWGGSQVVQPAADHVLHLYSQPRRVIAEFVGARLFPYSLKSILAIPYTREDVVMALAAKAISGAPLAIWVMDDNCLSNDGVPTDLMRELVSAADARFVISDPMRAAYERHFATPFWVLPPLVARRFIRTEPSAPPEGNAPRGCIVGNIWHQAWLAETLRVLRGSAVPIEWYTSSNDLHFLTFTDGELAASGIAIHADLDHREIARRVERSTFVLTPSFSGTETDGHAAAIGRLSLPSKMPFVTASGGVPFLVLANGPSGAADYARTFALGEVVAYDADAIRAAVARLSDLETQRRVRTRSFDLGPSLDVTGLHEFLIASARARGLADDRFERLFSSAGLEHRLRSDARLDAPPPSSGSVAPAPAGAV